MAFVSTTIAKTVAPSDSIIQLASVTGIAGSDFSVGPQTSLLVGSELMVVQTINTTTNTITVMRGQGGSKAGNHPVGETVLAGLQTDFRNYRPVLESIDVTTRTCIGFSTPVASATSITASGSLFHLTGSTQVSTMLPFGNYVEGGPIRIIFDGGASMAAGSSSYQFATAVAAPVAGTYIEFILDGLTMLWYASRPA